MKNGYFEIWICLVFSQNYVFLSASFSSKRTILERCSINKTFFFRQIQTFLNHYRFWSFLLGKNGTFREKPFLRCPAVREIFIWEILLLVWPEMTLTENWDLKYEGVYYSCKYLTRTRITACQLTQGSPAVHYDNLKTGFHDPKWPLYSVNPLNFQWLVLIYCIFKKCPVLPGDL